VVDATSSWMNMVTTRASKSPSKAPPCSGGTAARQRSISATAESRNTQSPFEASGISELEGTEKPRLGSTLTALIGRG
jgi:hypothetical protein